MPQPKIERSFSILNTFVCFRTNQEFYDFVVVVVSPFLCNICGSAFPSAAGLKRHADAVHKGKFGLIGPCLFVLVCLP